MVTPVSIQRSIFGFSILQGSRYLFPLAALPVFAKTLSLASFGSLMFHLAITAYLIMIGDFGFSIWGVTEVTKAKNSKRELRIAYANVFWAKSIALCVCLIAICATGLINSQKINISILLALMLSVVGQVLHPMWYFQALEHNLGKIITYDFVGKILAFACILAVAIQHASPFFYALAYSFGFLFPCCFSLVYLHKKQGMTLNSWRESRPIYAIRESFPLFSAALASNLYTSSTTVALGLFSSPAQVAIFASAEKVMRALIGLLNPVAQALLPRMVSIVNERPKDFAAISRRILINLTLWSLAIAIVTAASSSIIVRILYSEDLTDAAQLLRVLCPLLPLIALSNFAGIQTLVPFGYQKKLSVALWVAALSHLGLLLPAILQWGAIGGAGVTLVSEALVTIFLFVYLRILALPPFHNWR